MTTGMPSSRRDELRDAALAYVHEHGWTDLSLRALAEELGTSHRMLIHHFGSKEALLIELVEVMEQRERDATTRLGGTAELASALRAAWERVADPAMAPHERLFFELYGQALQGRQPAASLLPGLVHDWLEMVPEPQRPLTRLSLAVIRGLLADLLATGERAEVDAAMALFVEMAASTFRP
jgi:AcrR family transcriptional regulator